MIDPFEPCKHDMYWELGGKEMPRNAQNARRGQGRQRKHQSATLELERLSRANQARFDAAPKEPLYALYARFREEREFATEMAPAYLLGVSPKSGGGPRVRLLVQSRNGRYIDTWQPRKRLGNFRLVRVTPDQMAYSFLSVYLGAKDRVPTEVYSRELVTRFCDLLGETFEQDPLRGYAEAV